MKTGQRLIASDDEYQAFLDRSPRFPRFAQKWSGGEVRAASAQPLASFFDSAIAAVHRAQDRAWSGVVVAVDEGDGMTWSAAVADGRIIEAAPTFRRFHLTRDQPLDGYPQIAKLVSRGRVVALAQEAEVAVKIGALRSRWVVAAAIALLAAGALSTLISGLVRRSGDFQVIYLLLGAALGLVVFAGQEAASQLKRSEREAARRKVLDQIDSSAADRTSAWERFVDALVHELNEQVGDRAIIVDDFDKIDITTQAVLRRAVLAPTPRASGRDFWVVFEDTELGSLRNEIRLREQQEVGVRRPPGMIRRQTIRQLNLDEDGRARLAREAGAPSRADFRRVRSIVFGPSRTAEIYVDVVSEQFHTQQSGDSAYGPLEVLYLLAVTHVTGAVDFRPADLIRDWAAASSTATGAVLRLVLPGATLSRAELGGAFDGLVENLSECLDTDQRLVGRVELLREAAETVINGREAYGLKDLSVAHLFWALFLFAKLGGTERVDDPYRLRKLGRHLVAATPPSALGNKVPKDVRQRYVAAATWAALQLLDASIPENVPALLRLAEREAASAGERRRLRSACWQAYAVLGSEEVLATLLQLHTDRAGARTEISDLDRLFVESIELRSSGISRAEITQRLRSLEPDVTGYARTRALWLALVMSSPSGSVPTVFSRASEDAVEQAENLVRAALERLRDPGRPRAPTDALTVSLGLWCYALAVRRDGGHLKRINGLLEDVRLRAWAVLEELAGPAAQRIGGAFVLRALMHEIELMVSAAAALVQMRGRVTMVAAPVERKRLADHVAALPGARRGQNPLEVIAKRMTLQSLTWVQLGFSERNPFGFEQLASYMTLRRTHFRLLWGEGEHTVQELNAALSGMAVQTGAGGWLSLLAHAIVMGEERRHDEFGGLLIARAVDQALVGGMGAELKRELSFLAVSRAHSYQVSLRRPLESLADGTGAAVTDLSARISDSDRRDEVAVMWFLNASRFPEIPSELVDRVVRDVEAYAQGCDAEGAEIVRDRIEVFEIARLVDEEAPVDVSRLNRWDGRSANTIFAFALYLLLGYKHADGSHDTLLDYSAQFLRECPDPPTSSAPMLLAAELAWASEEHSDPRKRHDYQQEALLFIDRWYDGIAHLLRAEMNLQLLDSLLFHEVGDTDRRWRQRVEWEAWRQARDGIEKLPGLIADGRYFFVIWHYYETLNTFGLETHPSMDPQELLSLTDAACAAVVAQWSSDGAVVPGVIARRPQGTALSAEFVRVAWALFRAVEDDEHDEARSTFNRAAANALEPFYAMAIETQGLPEQLTKLLLEHRARLVRPRSLE